MFDRVLNTSLRGNTCTKRVINSFFFVCLFFRQDSSETWIRLTKLGNEAVFSVAKKNKKIQSLYIFTLSDRAVKLSRNLCQKSLNNGLSIFFKLSLVLASTLT